MTRRVLIFAVVAAAVLGAAPASQAASVNARERAESRCDVPVRWLRVIVAPPSSHDSKLPARMTGHNGEKH